MNFKILNDRYEILQQLGKRTGRETLLSRDLSTQKLVVLKLLKFNSEFEWDDLKLFEREAQTLQDLSHPQIPQYLDFFEFEVPQYKGFALVQTYLKAKSLEQNRQFGRTFTEEEVQQIAEQLLEILTYLHDRHPPVIHRDLKPSNILLGDRSAHSVGKVYLVDFGSVQNMAAVEGGTFTVVGTYGYMPPEQFGGRTVPASDLYSLGATLINLLTGRHPADLPQKNLQIDIAKVAKLSPGFDRWLGKLLEPSLDRRFDSSEVALKELQNSDVMNTRFEKTKLLPGSKVLISRDLNNLTIVFPGHTLYCSLLLRTKIENFNKNLKNCFYTYFGCFSGLLFFMLIGMIWISILIPVLTSFTFGRFVFTLIFVLIFSTFLELIVRIILESILLFLGYLRPTIQLDRENMTIIEAKKYKTSFPISSIVKIEKTLPYIDRRPIEEGDTTERLTRDTLVKNSIVIWVGTTQCEIKNLSEPELDWLGAELSDWLGLPLTPRGIPIIESSRPKPPKPPDPGFSW